MTTVLSVERRSVLHGTRVPTTVVELQNKYGEVRTFNVPDQRAWVVPTDFEVETRDDGAPMAIRGLGIVFDSFSQDLGGFIEQMDRGSVRKALSRGSDVVISVNHDYNNILGRTSANTAEVREVPKGVTYRAVVNEDDPSALAWAARIARGDVRGSSFTFTVARDKWEEREDGSIVRTVLEVGELFEMGPVVSPAYLQTDSFVGRELPAQAEAPVEVDAGEVGDESELRETVPADVESSDEARLALVRELHEGATRRLSIARTYPV